MNFDVGNVEFQCLQCYFKHRNCSSKNSNRGHLEHFDLATHTATSGGDLRHKKKLKLVKKVLSLKKNEKDAAEARSTASGEVSCSCLKV